MIDQVPGTNLVRIHVWHRGQHMAVYVPADYEQLEYGQVHYPSIDGTSIEVPPVPGIVVPLTPDMLNAENVSFYDGDSEEVVTYYKGQEFYF